MAVRINGIEGELLNVADRALAYGDGVYRTLELANGVPKMWPYQYARLQADCAALALELPEAHWLLDELAQAAQGLERAVAKVVVSRGVGARGYAIPADANPTVIVSASAWGGYPAECAREGVAVRWCRMQLALQPRLAGIKHLNRLENVLARSEWQDPALREGLLCDTEGNLVEGTMSNIFVVQGRRVLTPLLDRCGVSGAMRARVMDCLAGMGYPVEVCRLRPQALARSDELWLCNSLIGLWPVARLEGLQWRAFPLAHQVQQALAADAH